MQNKLKLLITLEASFEISGRGVVLVPFIEPEIIGDMKHGDKAQVRLVLPAGSEIMADATFCWEHFNPSGFHFLCTLSSATQPIPKGTEVWLLEDS